MDKKILQLDPVTDFPNKTYIPISDENGKMFYYEYNNIELMTNDEVKALVKSLYDIDLA